MVIPNELNAIIERITNSKHTDGDLAALLTAIKVGSVENRQQLGKYNINIKQGQGIQIGDSFHVELNDEVIQALLSVFQQQSLKLTSIPENLPRSGVVKFVGRTRELELLHQQLQQNERLAISSISGMGGVGKTELALQYALAHKQTYQGGICWLQAKGVNLGTQIVQFVRSHFNINPPEELDLTAQVEFCWSHWYLGEVLIILDDVTSYDYIKPYLPPLESRFKILITTRLRLGKSINILEIDVLEESAALILLESLVESERIQRELDHAKKLCAWLEYLPLGLELVGRYLARKPDLSLAKMQSRLEVKRLQAKALQETEADMTARSGVAAAFELSWEMLDESAQKLGCLLSLFAIAPIPWSLVEQIVYDKDPEDLEEIRDEVLVKLHLLKRIGQHTYRLHQLIREFFQEKLVQLHFATQLKQEFCKAIIKVAKQITHELTADKIVALIPAIPHIVEVAEYLTIHLNDNDFPLPFQRLGRFYENQGLYDQAEYWYLRGLEVSEKKFGKHHLTTATSLNDLAYIYKTQGRYQEAEPLYLKSLEIRKSWFGEEHTSVAQSLNNLATIYRKRGRYSEAEKLLIKVVYIRKSLLGETHIYVAQCLDHLAYLYYEQGYYSKAEALYLEAIAIYDYLQKRNHPHVPNILNNQALLYQSQGRTIEAERLYLEALSLMKNLRGEKHHHVGNVLINLAKLYHTQERYEEAKKLYTEALEIYDKLLGKPHPDIVIIRENFDYIIQKKI